MQGFLKNEVAIANMPRIRVQPRSTKKGSTDDMMGGFGISNTIRNSIGNRHFSNFLGNNKLYDLGGSDYKK